MGGTPPTEANVKDDTFKTNKAEANSDIDKAGADSEDPATDIKIKSKMGDWLLSSTEQAHLASIISSESEPDISNSLTQKVLLYANSIVRDLASLLNTAILDLLEPKNCESSVCKL